MNTITETPGDDPSVEEARAARKGTYKIKVKISVAANKRFKAKSAKKDDQSPDQGLTDGCRQKKQVNQ